MITKILESIKKWLIGIFFSSEPASVIYKDSSVAGTIDTYICYPGRDGITHDIAEWKIKLVKAVTVATVTTTTIKWANGDKGYNKTVGTTTSGVESLAGYTYVYLKS